MARSDRVAGAVVRRETAADGTGLTAYTTGNVAEPGGTLLGLLVDRQSSPREVRALHALWTRTLAGGLFDTNISRRAVRPLPGRPRVAPMLPAAHARLAAARTQV